MGQPILEVEHLKKSYVNNVPILDDVSFSMQKGEVVVIVGPSGCGKSTFLRCINRLEETDSGVLKLNGVSYEKEKKNISKVREKIGMVFQSYDLFPNMTILNNLLLAPLKVQKRNKEEVKKEAEQLLERVGLLDKKDSYPRQLSGGQFRRAGIHDHLGTNIVNQEHGQIHAEHHGRIVEGKDFLNKGKILAYILCCPVKLLGFIGLADKGFYHTDAGYVLLYGII